jgi:hypothetical protein
VRACQGCYDGALAYRTPFISGKDSLYNEFNGQPIPGTLLISAIGIVPEMHAASLRRSSSRATALSVGRDAVPSLADHCCNDRAGTRGRRRAGHAGRPLLRYRALHRRSARDWCSPAHDLSEGGLAVALAEMCMAGRLGAAGDAGCAGRCSRGTFGSCRYLFSESNGRLLLEVAPRTRRLRAHFADMAFTHSGRVAAGTGCGSCTIGGAALLELTVDELVKAWWKGYPMKPSILILHASGTNRDGEAARACEAAGGAPEIVHINQLRRASAVSPTTRCCCCRAASPTATRWAPARGWRWTCKSISTTNCTPSSSAARSCLASATASRRWSKPGCCLATRDVDWMRRARCNLQESHSIPDRAAQGHADRKRCRPFRVPVGASAAIGRRRAPGLRDLDELIFCPMAHGEGNFQVKDAAMLAEMEQRRTGRLPLCGCRWRPPTASIRSTPTAPSPTSPGCATARQRRRADAAPGRSHLAGAESVGRHGAAGAGALHGDDWGAALNALGLPNPRQGARDSSLFPGPGLYFGSPIG